MNVKLSMTLTSNYFYFGVLYGVGRSFYWLSKTKDESYTKVNGLTTLVSHPHTYTTKFLHTISSAFISQLAWPFFILSDLNYYQKNKLGVRDIYPPFPFNNLKWKD